MSAKRLIAILFIYACTAVAWFILATSVVVRTGALDQTLAREVARLWGGPHTQVAPSVFVERPKAVTESVQEKDSQGRSATRDVTKTVLERAPVPPLSSRVKVDLSLDQRRKGLLWYDTYGVVFEASYRVQNPDDVERTIQIHFTFPSSEAIYDAFVFRVGGREVPSGTDLSQGVIARASLPPGGETKVDLAYRSRGMDTWNYAFTSSGVGQVRDLVVEMTTDFEAIDFPAGTFSPTRKSRQGSGWKLSWEFESLVTGQQIGMDMPNRLNPGPVAARITFFAPVSLLFFMTVMVILGVLKEQNLHPMNYFFLAAAFFSFHLLLAYLVDHIHIHAAFLIAAGASILLVVTYLRLVSGMRLALMHAGLAQLVFLVLFSYAFFFEGYTGLTLTVGAVLTLFVLMQLTGRVDWGRTFSRTGGRQRAASHPPAEP